MRIVIVDSDTPELAAKARRNRGASNADRFDTTLAELRPEAERVMFAPYGGETPDFEFADGAVFTGSMVAWGVDDVRGVPLANAMEDAFAADIPVWGSCNGMLLAAVLLGGATGNCVRGLEAGLALDVDLTPDGAVHPMMKGRRARYTVPCIHRHEVQRLPEGAVLLAQNAHSDVQAFAYEADGVRFWGTQYHPEYRVGTPGAALAGLDGTDPDLVADLMAADDDPAAARRLGADPADLTPRARTVELQNWMRAVAAC